MDIPNPINPDRMSAKERVAEVARILALGLIRLRARQSTHVTEVAGESFLHFAPDQSGHAKAKPRRIA
jgi:hypothetical protein